MTKTRLHLLGLAFVAVVATALTQIAAAASKSFDSSQPIFLKTLTARELRDALKLP
jgi:hypothetical protein